MRKLNPSGTRKGKKGHLLCWGWGGAATPTRAEARAACGGRSPVATGLTLHTITGSREEPLWWELCLDATCAGTGQPVLPLSRSLTIL